MDLAAPEPVMSTARHSTAARVGVVLGILVTATVATFAAALVLLSVTQPAVVVRVMDQGTIGPLLRAVVMFVASGVARLLHYL